MMRVCPFARTGPARKQALAAGLAFELSPLFLVCGPASPLESGRAVSVAHSKMARLENVQRGSGILN